MGLSISVMRDTSSPDCTNGGVSSKHSRLCVVNVRGPSEPSADCPAVRLEMHFPGCLRLVPVLEDGAKAWFMMGGNFGHSCDSRFSEACELLTGQRFYGAVAIHDRIEG